MSSRVRGNYDFAAPPGAALTLERPLVVLGGPTGSGKTAVLGALAARGVQVLDLEALAGHRGSAFGGLGLPAQPSHDAFQRRVDDAWRGFSPARAVLGEHEAAYLGRVGIPPALQRRLADAPWIELVAPLADRVARTAQLYAGVDRAALIAAVRRLRRRHGDTDEIEALVARDALDDAIDRLLPYYDDAYAHQRPARPALAALPVRAGGEAEAASAVLACLSGHDYAA